MRNQNDGSDMMALDERQAELDAFEAQREAYNKAMLDMQQEREQEQAMPQEQEQEQEPAPVKPLEMAVGGDASLKALLAQNTETLSDELPEEPPINTDPVGTAQKMLASLTQTKKSAASPTAKSIKKSAGKGGASAGKEMDLSYESLTAAKELAPALKETGSARSQMEALAKAYKLRAQAATQQSKGFLRDTMNAPTLDKPNLGRATLAAKRFDKGGEADALEGMQKKARENEMYGAAEKYLQSREQIPDIELKRLGLKEAAVFSSLNLPIGSGTITLNKDDIDRDSSRTLGEALLAHEITHAADRQMKQQAIEQRGKGTKFAEAYEKLMGPEGRNRASLARRLDPEWESENRSYRSAPGEIAAFGVGAFSTPVPKHMTPRRAPLHVDSTAATEFQILLDLAQRDIDKGPKGIERVPRFLRKFFKYADGGPVYRAEGSPEEGETAPPAPTQEEIDAASKPSFRTSKSGINRPEGEISRQLRSGAAYVNMAKGFSELPYNLAGAPMDIAMLLRQGLTGQAPAGQVGTSDYIKNKMTELGIRQAPPTDPTAKGFYTAGDLLSNLVNPASVPRKVGPAIERGVKAGATEVGRQLDRAIMDNAGPLAKAVPDAARPMYAVRPTGSMTSMNNPAADSRLERLIADGRRGEGVERTTEGMENFWNVKARNYFEKQFGTPDDPIADALKAGRIKSEAVQATDAFPNYLTDQLSVGRTRTREGERPDVGFVGPGAPSTRFFPKYPQAMEEFTSRYDTATGLKGDVVTTAPGMGHDMYPNMVSPLGSKLLTRAEESARERLAAQGVREELANTNIELTARSEKDPTQSTGYSSPAKMLLEAYEKAKEKPSMLSRLGLASETKPEEMLSQSVVTAIEKGEPIYDTSGIKAPLRSLFDPAKINKYLTTLPERELKKVRFEDVVQGANKMFAEEDASRALADRIRNGKNVPDKVFSDGVSSPLLQFDKRSGYNGYAWKRLETPEATVPEGAYLGHSVGGYKLGGVTYSKEKMQDFKDGRYQVYTLRDNRNRPVTTVEVQMIDEYTPAVMQIKGNGRATGNTAPEDYDYLVLDFFQNYLHPAQISEKDSYLTPLLQRYKEGINANFKMP